jgi:CheY-like chemotaxis protein
MARILVIDDKDDIRHLVSLILSGQGFDVIQAPNGPEGLALIAQGSVDLVLLDIMMPGMDGWHVCRQLKNSPLHNKIPVVIITVRNQPIDEEIGLQVVHADAFLGKPFARQELIDTVTQLLAPVA